MNALQRDLERILGPERVSVNPAILAAHSHDEAFETQFLPDVVVFAHTREDVVALMRYAHANRVPVTPFAVGSSLEGHALARFGGVSLDVSKMDGLLGLHPEDLLAVVQPGLTYPRLNALARPHGLFMPVDPGAEASLGGMAATGASGTNAVRYGTMRDFVMALEVVLPNGEVVRTGSRARKSSSGLDLTRLLVGSEGTLGVFTELTIKLVGLPSAVSGAVVTFPGAQNAVNSAVGIIQAGIPVARMEFIDALAVRAVNRYKGLNLREAPTLFLEFHGSTASVQAEANLADLICTRQGGTGFAHSLDANERSRLWEARHHAWFALKASYPGKHAFSTDVAVPISRLPESLAFAQALLLEEGLVAPVVGHVGDGNYHLLIVHDPNDQTQTARARAINEAVVRHAIALGGTATGEHGVGIGKRKFMMLEHGASLTVMRQIKRMFDPLGIMNPGKLVDGLDDWPKD